MTQETARPQMSREGMDRMDAIDHEVRQMNSEWRKKQKEWDEEHNH
ncbi:MAG: hypothetical protein IBX39_08100 [Candidatus Methanoperedenaceae archaeon]|nr:hypothetical protein [Candidatus Methanoperedenaceae archaeon]